MGKGVGRLLANSFNTQQQNDQQHSWWILKKATHHPNSNESSLGIG
jgi:phage terminase small subunit